MCSISFILDVSADKKKPGRFFSMEIVVYKSINDLIPSNDLLICKPMHNINYMFIVFLVGVHDKIN